MADDFQIIQRQEQIRQHLEEFFTQHPDLNPPGKREQFLQFVVDNKLSDLDLAHQRFAGNGLKGADTKQMFDAMDSILDREVVEEKPRARLSFKEDEDGNVLTAEQQKNRFDEALDYALKTDSETKDLASNHNDSNKLKMEDFHNKIDEIFDRSDEPKEAFHEAPVEELGVGE